MSGFEYNAFQEQLLQEFIDSGGRLVKRQRVEQRGAGYSTFVAVQCLQQALHSDRSVVYVTDYKHDYGVGDMCRLASQVFGVEPVFNRNMGRITIGDTMIKVVRPRLTGDSLRGCRIDDVFVDIPFETTQRNREFFETLEMAQSRSNASNDGTGILLMVTW